MMDWLCSQYRHFINGQALLPIIFPRDNIPQLPTNPKGLGLKTEAGHKCKDQSYACEVQQIKLEFHHMASRASRVESDIKK